MLRTRVLVVALVSLYTFMHASALTISPARLELNGDPGSVIESEIILQNDENRTVTLYTSSENFEASGESGVPKFVAGKTGLSTWVQSTPQLTLQPHERKVLSFTVTIPKDADAGGHFAALFVGDQDKKAQANAVTVGSKLGTLLLLRVNGDIIDDATVAQFTTAQNTSFYTSLPISFTYRFTNNGTDRVFPEGYVTIRNTIGMVSEKVLANPVQGNILPKSTRRFEVTWGEDPESKSFSDVVSHQYNNFAFGFYRATLDLRYGANGSDTSDVRFFVFPWQLLLVASLIAFIMLVLVSRSVKKYNAWIIAHASRQSRGS